MTVRENLELGAVLRKGGPDADFDHVHTLFPRLQERDGQLAGTLSGGEQQMVAMGRALMSRPRLLLMDEPSMGLSPALVQQNFRIIKEVHESGVAVLMVEQNANMALSIADRGYVLSTGSIVLSGPAAELLTTRISSGRIWVADRGLALRRGQFVQRLAAQRDRDVLAVVARCSRSAASARSGSLATHASRICSCSSRRAASCRHWGVSRQ